MHFLRFIFSVLVILILIILAGLLLPSKVTVSKSTLINATQTRIDSEIQDFNNWKNWYPAFQNENVSVINNPAKPNILNSISLKDDKGKQLDLDLVESKPDTTSIILESQSTTKVNYQFILTSHSDGQTQLTWNVNTTLGWYRWEKIKGIFLDKISGPQYEAALANLKKASEK